MNIPYDFNPVGKTAAVSKAKTATIWEITTTGANNTYRFRLSDYQGETNIIEWGDGTIAQSSSSSNTDYTHTYTNAGTYTIKVLGNHTNIQLGATSSSYGKYVSKVIQLCDSLIDCSRLFYYCSNLTSLPDGFTISNSVTDCSYMFSSCSNLTSLPDGFTIPNSVTNCYYMFYSCSKLTSLPDGFTIPNSVTSCSEMFTSCSNLASLPEGFTISNSVTSCSYIFSNCQKLASLPDGFTIPNSVTSCILMFSNCQNLVYDISILLSEWTAKTRNVQSCFNNCKKLIGQAPANVLWNVQSITSYSSCFTNCTSLSNYYSIPYSWGGGAVQMADQKLVVIDSNQEIQLDAVGGGTLTFTSDDLPEGVSLSSDGKLTGFSVDGTYTINVKCSSSYGSEASAIITVYVNQTLQKTQNNLTSNTSSDFVVVYDQSNNSSAYKAMDGDLSTYSSSSFSASSASNFRIDFSQPIITKFIYLKLHNGSTYTYNYYLQASEDGNTWIRIYDQIIPNTFYGNLLVNLDTPYQYYRLLRANSGYCHFICEIIFYYKYVENYLSAKDQTITAQLGEQFTYQIEYQNYSETPVEFSLQSELPEGIYFDNTTGTFSGSSSVQITKSLIVTLTNTYKTISITIKLEIANIFTTPHNLTSNTSDPRYIVSLSDNLESAKRHAWNAMDGSLNQLYGCAHTGSGINKWWKIQFNEAPVYIEQFILTNRESGGNGGTSFILQGSTDDNTWVDVYPFTADRTNGKIFEFVVNSQQAYKYWRIFQTTSNYLIIGQIEFRYKLQ